MFAECSAAAEDAPYLDFVGIRFRLDGMYHAVSLAIVRCRRTLVTHSRFAMADGLPRDMVYTCPYRCGSSCVAAPTTHGDRVRANGESQCVKTQHAAPLQQVLSSLWIT